MNTTTTTTTTTTKPLPSRSRYHRKSIARSSSAASRKSSSSISSGFSTSSAPPTTTTTAYYSRHHVLPFLSFRSSASTSISSGSTTASTLSPNNGSAKANIALRQMPPHVHNLILEYLEYLHTGPRQTGCLTCLRRDLHSLSLTCRAWERASRQKL